MPPCTHCYSGLRFQYKPNTPTKQLLHSLYEWSFVSHTAPHWVPTLPALLARK